MPDVASAADDVVSGVGMTTQESVAGLSILLD